MEESRLCPSDLMVCEGFLVRVATRQGQRRRSRTRSLRCRGQNEIAPRLQIRHACLNFGLGDRKHPMPAGIAMPPGILSTGRKIRMSTATCEVSLDRVFGLFHL